VVSVLLMAPQTDEWGTKVGLLAGLVVISLARPILERLLPKPSSETDQVAPLASRLATGSATRRMARLGVAALAVLVIGSSIVAAGAPARGPALANADELLNGLPTNVDPATLPAITVGADVVDFDHTLAGSGMNEVVVTLARNLELENQALLLRDGEILVAVDHGDRLVEMQERLRTASTSGTTVLTHYQFDAIDVSLLVPFGAQSGLSLGLAGRGTMTTETRDADGGRLIERESSPFDLTFAMRRATGDRWMNVAVVEGDGS